MKKVLFILLLLTSVTSVSFSNSFGNFQFGANLGDIGLYRAQNGGFITGSIGSINTIETNTGLGFNLYIWSLLEDNKLDNGNETFSSYNFIGPEVTWEPMYNQYSEFGWKLFYRMDHIINPDMENWRAGVKGEFRVLLDNLTPYPLCAVETGYWNNKGFYIGLKFDPVVAIAVAGIGYLTGIKEQGEEWIPNK